MLYQEYVGCTSLGHGIYLSQVQLYGKALNEIRSELLSKALHYLPSSEMDIEPKSIILGDGYDDIVDEWICPSCIKVNI